MKHLLRHRVGPGIVPGRPPCTPSWIAFVNTKYILENMPEYQTPRTN